MTLRTTLEWLEEAVDRMLLICDMLEGKSVLSPNEDFVLKYMKSQANNIVSVALGQTEQIEQYYQYAIEKNKHPHASKGIADIVVGDKAIQQKVTVTNNYPDLRDAIKKATEQISGTHGEQPGDKRRAIQIYIYSEENPWPFTSSPFGLVDDLNLLISTAQNQIKGYLDKALDLDKSTLRNYTNTYNYPPLKNNPSQTSSRRYAQHPITQTRTITVPPMVPWGQPTTHTQQQTTIEWIEVNTVEVKIRWLCGRLVCENHLNKVIYGLKFTYFRLPTSPEMRCETTKIYRTSDL